MQHVGLYHARRRASWLLVLGRVFISEVHLRTGELRPLGQFRGIGGHRVNVFVKVIKALNRHVIGGSVRNVALAIRIGVDVVEANLSVTVGVDGSLAQCTGTGIVGSSVRRIFVFVMVNHMRRVRTTFRTGLQRRANNDGRLTSGRHGAEEVGFCHLTRFGIRGGRLSVDIPTVVPLVNNLVVFHEVFVGCRQNVVQGET